MPLGELATCMESLAEQVASVLEEVSWPAHRQKDTTKESEGDVATAELPQASGAAAEGFAYITLDQFDALDRLVQTLSAHGDVVACSHAAELADHTLYDGVEAVRAILREVEEQQLGQRPGPRNGVGETRAVYRADYALADADDMSALTLPAPVYAYTGQRPH
jgi:hypothetical protein